MKFWLRTFGDLRLLDEQGHATAFPEKGLVIIACLIAADRASVPRVTVAEFLWGKSTPSTSFTNLRSLISRIKNRQLELDRHFLSFSESRIGLNSSLLTCDVSAFGVAGPEEPLEKLALLVGRFHEGLFLEGVSIRSTDFGDWLAQQRERQTIALERALDIARPLAAKPGEIALVKEAALLVSLAHPQDEVARRVLIEAHDAQGEVNHLRSVFERRSHLLSSWAAAAKRSPKGAVISTKADSPASEVTATEAAVHPMARVPRLALLPPTNHSRDAAAAGIVTALLEDITIGFCVLNSIQVMAPYSAVQISRQTADKVAAFEHHDVSYVLDTRLSGVSGDLSLFCQLIYMANNEIVWAERFSIDGRDLARNHRAISRRLALSVASEIERHRVTRSHFEQNPAAYHRYLIGRQYFTRLTLPNLRRARREMKAALQESPNFAPALSSIARTYSEEWFLTARGDVELLKSAETFALQAIAARDDMADGYRELGVAKLQQGALDESVEALELAETLSPHYADVIADHADTLAHCSQLEAACQKIEQAIELNPLSPDAYLWTAAGANYGLGRFAEALAYIDRMTDSSLADRLSAASWAMLGDTAKARSFVRRARETHPDFDVDKWLSIVPIKERWHKDIYREGLRKAGF
ncbi:hypothetical protein CN172_11080 [Sinorhizobium meliloti]|uniref:hypothetical protein n=1 Tax=Rhizobium meliloti TaxID=382 RepID=UPI000FDB8C91|nr:hypothetical protein [Sinorhizobium meliloti]RVG01320.1 hypothetical protein CN232_10365 [Sinorhizobium meliloti]RVH44139.1 hypothetical protein CN208_13220 [Sinorhizobium meliloti]RVK16594.1 hypothetical protein CN172_11080 [Sinorhizobium meliloti]